jgi:hypothetical protein
MDHPECQGSQGIEPSVGEMLRLNEFLEGIKKLGEQELRALCSRMAHQNLVAYPATLRWLAREAARSAFSEGERRRIGEALVEELVTSGGLAPPPLLD